MLIPCCPLLFGTRQCPSQLFSFFPRCFSVAPSHLASLDQSAGSGLSDEPAYSPAHRIMASCPPPEGLHYCVPNSERKSSTRYEAYGVVLGWCRSWNGSLRA